MVVTLGPTGSQVADDLCEPEVEKSQHPPEVLEPLPVDSELSVMAASFSLYPSRKLNAASVTCRPEVIGQQGQRHTNFDNKRNLFPPFQAVFLRRNLLCGHV